MGGEGFDEVGAATGVDDVAEVGFFEKKQVGVAGDAAGEVSLLSLVPQSFMKLLNLSNNYPRLSKIVLEVGMV